MRRQSCLYHQGSHGFWTRDNVNCVETLEIIRTHRYSHMDWQHLFKKQLQILEVLWSLSIPVRGKPHSSFHWQPQSCRETFIKWRSPFTCAEESLFSPEAHLTGDQSQRSLRRIRAPCPPRPEKERDWCIVGSMGWVSVPLFPASPAVPYLVAFDRTSLSRS